MKRQGRVITEDTVTAVCHLPDHGTGVAFSRSTVGLFLQVCFHSFVQDGFTPKSLVVFLGFSLSLPCTLFRMPRSKPEHWLTGSHVAEVREGSRTVLFMAVFRLLVPFWVRSVLLSRVPVWKPFQGQRWLQRWAVCSLPPRTHTGVWETGLTNTPSVGGGGRLTAGGAGARWPGTDRPSPPSVHAQSSAAPGTASAFSVLLVASVPD